MKNRKDSLGDRMKENYENRSKTYLVRRMPVIIRLDGKAFHTFTRGFKRPYDLVFHNAMNDTLLHLCKNIQGCKIGYTQSDEITLLLTDYDSLDTDAWFNYAVEKMCSVAASMATLAFNKAFEKHANSYIGALQELDCEEERDYVLTLKKAIENGAMFDARCFNIPKEEVANCFIWRQQDATRNAIQMLGQTYFSHKELDRKNQNDIQDMLMLEKGINFNNFVTEFKRGVCCIRKVSFLYQPMIVKTQWNIDKEIPIFTKDRNYIERFVYLEGAE